MAGRLAAGVLWALFLFGCALAGTEELLPQGSYRVTYWLELPHLERWAVRKEASVCFSGGSAQFPVLSGNTPFAGCDVSDWQRRGDRIHYRVACEGRDAARAMAAFRLVNDGFEGHIDMVMGAKNMTMMEVQVARRTGPCAQASRGSE